MSPKRLARSARQIIAALIRHGFVLLRQTGSHKIFGHPGRPELRVTVTDHGTRDLKPGTLKKILDQAKLTADDV